MHETWFQLGQQPLPYKKYRSSRKPWGLPAVTMARIFSLALPGIGLAWPMPGYQKLGATQIHGSSWLL